MKKKKTIIIKNPRLQKLRLNLRMVLIKAVSSEWNKLHEKQKKYLYDSLGNAKKMDVFEKEQFRKIERGKQLLLRMENRSVCRCPSCQKTDRNMIFNPELQTWYCIDCYEINKSFYRKRGQPQLFS